MAANTVEAAARSIAVHEAYATLRGFVFHGADGTYREMGKR